MNELPNPMLVQLLSEHLSLTPDETTALARGDVSSILTRRMAQDPRMAAMIPLLADSSESPDEDDEDDERGQRDSRRNDRKKERQSPGLAKARRVVGRLRDDLRAAYTVIHHIARMLGACPACFGNQPECERCHGHGAPGSAMPVRDELLAWVEPALARLGMTVTITGPKMRPEKQRNHNQGDQGE